jgi:opacity protein-like surface antigen
MKMTSAISTALVALIAVAASSTKSLADSGYVTLTIYKAGWVIGGSGGSGTLKFFGGSKTVLRGRVRNIDRPSDVAGVYGAAGAGLAVGSGARAIVLTNQKGAVLELSGKQVGLLANLDLSGLAITLK